MLVVLTGGTGGAKLIQGLSHEVDPAELTIVCNTADDFILHGLYICPDIDTITYTLAGVSDDAKGWGINSDTFTLLEQLEKYGCETWFKLGDKDLATHIARTKRMREGLTLSQVTDELRRSLGVQATVIPMSNDKVQTRVITDDGELSFQEFFVRERWAPEVKAVAYSGIEESRPAPGLINGILQATGIVICPSNPVTSIGPILAVPGIRPALKETKAPVLGISPIIQNAPVSGPAHKLMSAQGSEVSAFGVAKLYADLLDRWFIATEDEKHAGNIETLGIKVVATSIRMDALSDKRRLARELLAFIKI
ncbi:MAG TPA: 2-phospho-L-lactate transferase [Candidatus Binatia bacterium]|nr:2-phospho-L-lactate transferase [Candidatus Binatia bacterium]